MRISLVSRVLLVTIVSIAAVALVGCSKSDSQTSAGGSSSAGAAGDAASKWLGTYQEQGKDHMVLVLQADHKASMGPAGQAPADITWEVAGDDKINVTMGVPMAMFRTSDGGLRDSEGSTWKKTK
ncbi:MAG TPA: hypothetical protein VLI90_01195 [Tepidisphaeraceae bacterium]|nr:hypothetical protein [Tepidisphaeraceae bacterium]